MYIVNSARLSKKSRKLLVDAKGDIKLWVLPATCYVNQKNAVKAFKTAIKAAIEYSKTHGTFIKTHQDPEDPNYQVVETTDYIEIYRITSDTPTD